MESKCQTTPEPMGPTCSAMHQCSCIPAGMRRGLLCVCVCGGDITILCVHMQNDRFAHPSLAIQKLDKISDCK